MLANRRSPRRQRPRRRAILVFKPFGAALEPVARSRLTINKDQARRIEIGLIGKPGLARRLHIVALLLSRVAGLFFTVISRLSKNRHSVP